MEKNKHKKKTLYDYLMWIAEDEDNINVDLIRNELMLEMNDEDIMNFYDKYKNTEFLYVIILLFNIKKYGISK